MILRRTFGEDIPGTLAKLELVSKEWRDLVVELWQEIIEKTFTQEQIEFATEILELQALPVNSKNIYRVASNIPLNKIALFVSATQTQDWQDIKVPQGSLVVIRANNNVTQTSVDFLVNGLSKQIFAVSLYPGKHIYRYRSPGEELSAGLIRGLGYGEATAELYVFNANAIL